MSYFGIRRGTIRRSPRALLLSRLGVSAEEGAIALPMFALIVLVACSALGACAQSWRSLPNPSPMPVPTRSGMAPVNGIQMYYAVFGEGPPVLLIHGGLGDSADWGGVIPTLAIGHKVIVADSRGFGRSTRDTTPYSYGLMASDYLALLDYLQVSKVFLVGSSDGGIIGMDIAIHNPTRLAALFIQGVNATADGIESPPSDLTAIRLALGRSRSEYERVSTTPHDYVAFRSALASMEANEPDYTFEQLSTIRIPTMVARGDHEESIKMSHTEYIVKSIPGARLSVIPGASHFAPLQEPVEFSLAVTAFMKTISFGDASPVGERKALPVEIKP